MNALLSYGQGCQRRCASLYNLHATVIVRTALVRSYMEGTTVFVYFEFLQDSRLQVFAYL